MNSENSLKGFSSSHVELGEVVQPPIGRHIFTVKKVFFTNDRIKTLNIPTLKDKIPAWKDVTDQVAIVLWCPEGVITRRLQAFGFKRKKDIAETERHLYDFLGDEYTPADDLYAVRKDNGERVHSPERTAQCTNIINQVFTACGLPEGSTFEDLPGAKLSAEVYYKEYAGNQRKDVKNFRKVEDHQVVDLTSATANVELESDKF